LEAYTLSVPPTHKGPELVATVAGIGFTVIVKLVEAPGHDTPPFVNVGVTVIIPEIGAFVTLVAVNAGIPVALPPLLAARPIAGLLLVQV
jgi:hypothetical protein